MIRSNVFYSLVLIFLVWGSASSFISSDKLLPELDIAEYIKWIEDPINGLNVSDTVSNYQLSLQYKPINYTILKTSRGVVNGKDWAAERDSISGFLYFDLHVRCITDCKNRVRKEGVSKVEYLAFKMQSDIKLVRGKDTIPCSMAHYEGNMGITPYDNIMLAFEDRRPINQFRNHSNEELKVIYDDQFYGFGNMSFSIHLINVPDLKLPHDTH